MPRGKPTTMPAKIKSDIAIADAAFSDLFAQPHDENAARREGEHGHQGEADAGVHDEISAFLQADGDGKRLDRAKN